MSREEEGVGEDFVSALDEKVGSYSEEYSLILDESGEIRRLNNETLELSGRIGHLPSAPPFGEGGSIGPKGLFAYQVLPFTIGDEYAGTIVGSISREGNGLRVSVFDGEGKLIKSEATLINWYKRAGGPAWTIATYILENLGPAVFSWASSVTASSFEATAGHRGLFILPNSFAGLFGRDAGEDIISRFFFSLFIISPSIILGLLLGWRVCRDATVVGFSGRAKRYWFIGTIMFGLSAYIAYRLTRPKVMLVTCQNCGKMRRPDMERCHRCRSRWVVPELTPPSWRVIDGAGEKIAG